MVGVLALQGNYSKHIEILQKLKISSCEVRYNHQLNEINGLAIMSDTDNSKLKAISYYQNIYFSSE